MWATKPFSSPRTRIPAQMRISVPRAPKQKSFLRYPYSNVRVTEACPCNSSPALLSLSCPLPSLLHVPLSRWAASFWCFATQNRVICSRAKGNTEAGLMEQAAFFITFSLAILSGVRSLHIFRACGPCGFMRKCVTRLLAIVNSCFAMEQMHRAVSFFFFLKAYLSTLFFDRKYALCMYICIRFDEHAAARPRNFRRPMRAAK